ncbi:RES family NAD+ phosphorylase [Frankia tisae]|uniref:RES family NAD+ phosphorylase n=1 Tax=Frankia tisae TaxID=2950104 RepID=UPI0021C06ABC|nr:RES domain-containing protein [Frankia tisae]
MADYVGIAPRLLRESDLFVAVEGGFFRAVDPTYLDDALVGSRAAGRYSPPGRPTLYMSASPEGVNVAMIAHAADRASEPALIALSVTASRIVDLRDPVAREATGIDLVDTLAPWQELVASGGKPSSWHVREQLEGAGAAGLIDPSRRAPGLWHLVLFRWNRKGEPTVRRIAPGPAANPDSGDETTAGPM